MKNDILYFNYSVNLAESDTDTKSTDKKFEAVGYSGGIITQSHYFNSLIIDLEDVKFKSKVPIFFEHNPKDIVGAGKITIDDNKVQLTGDIYSDSDWGSKVISFSGKGFPWQLSIGINSKDLLFIDDGVEYKVNNKTHVGPFHVMKKNRIKEVSFTALGADPDTKAKIFNHSKVIKQSKNEELELDFKVVKEEVFHKDILIGKFSDVDGISTFCACQAKGKVSIEESELSSLKASLKETQDKIDVYEAEKKFSALKESMKMFKLSDDELKLFGTMSEEQRELFKTHLVANTTATKNIDDKLFKADNKDAEVPKGHVELTASEATLKAEAYIKEQADLGFNINFEEALSKI